MAKATFEPYPLSVLWAPPSCIYYSPEKLTPQWIIVLFCCGAKALKIRPNITSSSCLASFLDLVGSKADRRWVLKRIEGKSLSRDSSLVEQMRMRGDQKMGPLNWQWRMKKKRDLLPLWIRSCHCLL